MKRTIVTTGDGSHSLYNAGLDEHYHSIHGAVAESRHVFIRAGLEQFRPGIPVSILEVGFGTGLNALLTLIANVVRQNNIRYDALEAFPLTMDEAVNLNYTEVLEVPGLRPVFMRMHDHNWGDPLTLTTDFVLTKLQVKLQEFTPAPGSFDLVYFDAFAPLVQPELWTREVFDKVGAGMKQGGILVTYCSKGSVKRAMKDAGFRIEALSGPKGKREITRAIKMAG